MDSLNVNAEEIAQAALGVEYMSVAAPTGGANQTTSEQDWRKSNLPPRDDMSYAMGYQRNSSSPQLPLQAQPTQQVAGGRQSYVYNAGGNAGYSGPTGNIKGPPGNQQHTQLKQAFPMLGGPNAGGGPPSHAQQPISMPATSMAGYGPATTGKGGAPRGSIMSYGPTSSYAGNQSAYHNPTGYGNGAMSGGYGVPEFNSREGAYSFGVGEYEMAPADYHVEQEGGWTQRWDQSAGGGMRGIGGNGQRMMRGRGGMGGNMGNVRAQISRAIFINQVPPEVTYEELCDAVGAFGSLDSVKLLREKRQAFINFVEPQANSETPLT
ncbi:MAG: hypothetical protein SGPRY_011565 [Prymnesium sp.]